VHARVSILEGSPDEIDESLRQTREVVLASRGGWCAKSR